MRPPAVGPFRVETRTGACLPYERAAQCDGGAHLFGGLYRPAWSPGEELGDEFEDAEIVAEPEHHQRLGVLKTLTAGGPAQFGPSLLGHSHREL